MNHAPSDERLNAWIDGELTPADAAPLLEQLRTDDSLRQRVALMRLSKDLVRHAYEGTATTRRPAAASGATINRYALAGGVLAVALGTWIGWAARDNSLVVSHAPSLAAARLAGPAQADTLRVILHLSSSVPNDGLAVLERAEGILEAAGTDGREVTVEIVANSGGLDLLRQDVSAHAPRIAQLRADYPQLSLVACGQTAQRLRETGVTVQLLPGTTVASSALDEIVLRMQQGWAYIKI